MTNPQNRSADPAAREMLIRAGELGAKTVWDRHDDLKPLCGFGELGLCCDVCYMGPCRIDPFGERAQVGACGADLDFVRAHMVALEIVGVLPADRDLELEARAGQIDRARPFHREMLRIAGLLGD